MACTAIHHGDTKGEGVIPYFNLKEILTPVYTPLEITWIYILWLENNFIYIMILKLDKSLKNQFYSGKHHEKSKRKKFTNIENVSME